MFFDFKQYPGHLFIVATLLPLLSFILILLAGAVWSALRPYQKKPAIKPLFDLFGGDEERPNRGRWAAWTATGAIGLAFLLCLSGGIRYFQELPNDERKATKSKRTISELLSRMHGSPEKRKEFSKELIAARQELENVEGKWDGHWTWATVHPQHLPRDPTDFDEEAGEEHAEDSGTVLRLGFHIDALSVVMFVMVTLIATLIHLFSIGYMSEELQPVVEDHQVHTAHGHYHRRGRFGRFFLYLSLFCFSMLNLILADNLFQVFLSWELVGICSYLLIGFYFERQSASNAANKAFIVNRVGDAGFIIGILILFTYVGTLNFNEIFARIRSPLADTQRQLPNGGRMVRASVAKVTEDGKVLLVTGRSANSGSELVLFPSNMDADFNGLAEGDVQFAYNSPPPKAYGSMPYWLIVLAGLGIFLGCMGKSAQFPLQVWLPDAMEGPTPVSALIHAATMVAAGVYLVGRCYPLFTPEALLVIAYVGAITLFVAATVAVVMTDIKKVLAYSTVSQLGYMMLALGVGGWVAGLFHLITHAFFKALLFLCSGSVIYGCHHEQDMTKMGGLLPKMRITAISMLVGVLTIAGIPLFSGWYSKDAILASAFGFVYLNHHHAAVVPLAAHHGRHHDVLHVPHVAADIHGQTARPARFRSCPRIAGFDDRSPRHPGRVQRLRCLGHAGMGRDGQPPRASSASRPAYGGCRGLWPGSIGRRRRCRVLAARSYPRNRINALLLMNTTAWRALSPCCWWPLASCSLSYFITAMCSIRPRRGTVPGGSPVLVAQVVFRRVVQRACWYGPSSWCRTR